jgi:hypothetical protein
MSRIVDFYGDDEGTTTDGYTLEQIWGWDDDDYELEKNYVQWLFPTPKESRYNPDAPVLGEADIAAFRSDPLLRDRLRRSFVRFLRFLGLAPAGEGRVVEAGNFERRRPQVWSHFNHNWLRVSRVLTSLAVLGLDGEARALLAWLDDACRRGLIGTADAESRREAVASQVHWRQSVVR